MFFLQPGHHDPLVAQVPLMNIFSLIRNSLASSLVRIRALGISPLTERRRLNMLPESFSWRLLNISLSIDELVFHILLEIVDLLLHIRGHSWVVKFLFYFRLI